MQKVKTKPRPKGLKQHAKKLYHVTPKFMHGMVVGAFVGVLIVTTLGLIAPASALSISSPRDCDSNAVINCGALNTSELRQRYSNKGVAPIYNYFGISAKDIAAIDQTAVAGRVYKNGNVTINGAVVGTKALTAGRENITGSTRVVVGSTTFYKRPPSVSFRVDSIAAFVVMKDGQFAFAILAACGNPVKATPIPKKTTPPPVVSTAPPQEKTPEVPVEDVVTPSTQTPPSTPTPVVVARAVPPTATLPTTGPGALVVIGLLSVIGGYLFHATHRHIRHKRRLRSEVH